MTPMMDVIGFVGFCVLLATVLGGTAAIFTFLVTKTRNQWERHHTHMHHKLS